MMPYRQLGRPERWEILTGVFYPVAEGVVTLRHPVLPAAQMVLSLAADVRYLIYPSLFSKSDITGGLKSLLSTSLTTEQTDKLTQSAPAGMRVDPGKLNVLVGFNLHLYTSGGFIINAKAMLALALLGTSMPRHADFSFGIGYAF